MTDVRLRAIWSHLESARGQKALNLRKALLDLARGEIPGGLSTDVIQSLLEEGAPPEVGEFTSPRIVVDFMADFAAMHNPSSILDPVCGSGVMLQQALERCAPNIVHGVEINAESCEISRAILKGDGAVFESNAFDSDLDLADEYDLILADPPIGLRIQDNEVPESLHTFKLRDFSQYLAIWGCQKLSADGKLAVVMGPAALNQPAWVEAVHKEGCCIRASLHIPAGSRLNTGISSQVVIIQRGEQKAIFVGQLSRNDEHQERLLQNLKRHKPDKHPSLGRVCELEAFISYEALEAGHRIRERVRGTCFSQHRFADLIADESRQKMGVSAEGISDSSSNIVILPNDGIRFVSDPTEIPVRASHYTIFQLKPDRVNAQYLVNWFETELGKTALRAAGANSATGLARINKTVLDRLVCYLPSAVEQQETLEALRQLSRVKAEIQEIEASCWTGEATGQQLVERAISVNKEDRYEDWVESLPFPLASILWRHKVSGDDPRIRLTVLLHFFEAMAEFLATVHLSAFQSNKAEWRSHQRKLLEKLEQKKLTLDRATFGTWKLAVEFLSAAARKMLDDNEQAQVVQGFYSVQNEQWLRALCDPRLSTILSRANHIRNTFSGHGGALGKVQAASVENELIALVDQVRLVFGRGWQRYELVQADKMTYADGRFTFQCPRLMGTRNQFERVERVSLTPMETGKLYLLSDKDESGLKLLPFIRIMASPSSVASACYFYNRAEQDGQRFVSYHFEEEAEVCDRFEDIELAMRDLTTVPAQWIGDE